MRRTLVLEGLRDASPVVVAYVPIAMTFGVLSVSHGIPWLLTVFISIWVYAGGAQFMLVSLALSGVSAISAVLTVLLVNLRHVLYGTALGPMFQSWTEPKKWLFAFGLTDEVFAVTSGRMASVTASPWRQVPFAFTCYASWVAGTAAGGALGRAVPPGIADVLGFALTALFIALLFLGPLSGPHMAAAIIGAALSTAADLFHLGSIGIIVGAVAGATLGWAWHSLRSRRACPAAEAAEPAGDA
jgi:4-azaleucine resistance transporter AzlC